MYATVRLPGFDPVSSSFFGAQATQVPAKPTPDVQKLLDVAANLPIPDQKARLEQALELAISTKDNAGIRIVAESIHEWFLKSDSPTLSLRYFDELLNRANVSGERNFVAVAAVYKGMSAISQGFTDRGLEAYGIASTAYQFINDKRAMASVMTKVGDVYQNRGDMNKALTMHTESLRISLELADKSGIAVSLSNSAKVHAVLGNQAKAFAMHSESLTICRELGDYYGTASCIYNIALIHFDRGNLEMALAMHLESLEINTKLRYRRGIAMNQSKIAKIHSKVGDIDKALAMYMKSLTIERELRNERGIAMCLYNIAPIHVKRGNLDLALVMHTESLTICKKLGDMRGITTNLTNIASIHVERGNLDKAITLYAESLAICKESNDNLGIAVNLRKMASIQHDSGNLAIALANYSESLAIERELGDKRGITQIIQSIANVHSDLGDLDTALAMYSESLSICRQLGDNRGIATNLNNMAVIFYERRNLDEAFDLYSQALTINRMLKDNSGITYNLVNISWILLDRSDVRAALIALDESEAISRVEKLKDGLMHSLSLRADVLDSIGNMSAARMVREEAVRLSATFVGYQQITRTTNLMVGEGDSLLSQGKPDLALSVYVKARNLRLAAKLTMGSIEYRIGEAQIACGNRDEGVGLLSPILEQVRRSGFGNSRALIVLGRSKLSEGMPSLAAEPLQYALVSSLRDRIPEHIGKVYSALADHALAMKDRDVAIIHLKRAIEARQVQRRGSIGLDDAMTASLSLKVAPDYRKLAGLLTDAGRLGEAMEVAELLKRSEAKVRGGDFASDTPADQGKVSAAEATYRKAAEDLGKLGDRERFLSKVKYPSDNVKAEIAAMPAKLKVANKALTDALNRVVAEEKAAGSAAGRMRDTGAAQSRLAATLKRLGPGYAAVTVLCLPDSIRFLISTPKSLTMKRVAVTEKSLAVQVKALRDALLDPTSDPLPSTKALHTVLWAPIESELKRLGVKHVLLSLTGTARYVPFGALHNGTQYVAQGLGLSLYSPTMLAHIGDRTAKQWSVLAVGNSTERTVDDGIGSKLRFTSLPGVRAELSLVRQSVGSGPAPILDNDFTLASLKDGLAKQPSVVHLASHFQFDPRAESLSFLLTGQGEVLRASDTTVLTKDAFKGVDLLTLSACQTGTFSETADGMEVEGIASLMQRKGAGAVMSTLWPVADASTAAFMATFYTLRSQDPRRTKAWCLREAQLRMIRGEVAPPGAPKPVATRGTTSVKVSTKGLRKDWSHPYHWAPFILQGNPL